MRILYIDIDTLRPDHLGCYGYHRDTSPNIDAIAGSGTRFTDVHSSDVPCLPSRTALVTGTFGIRNGVNNHGGRAADLAPRGAERSFANQWVATSLPSVLARAGIRSASISSFPLRHGAMWWSVGFNESMNLMRGMGGERADEVLPGAIEWLERTGADDDWFLHVHFWDPHTPYNAPASFGNPFEGDPVAPWHTEDVRAHNWSLAGPHSAQEPWGFAPDEWGQPGPRMPWNLETGDDVKAMFDGYDVGIRYADDAVGRLTNTLADLGVLDDTLIWISSDHGEAFGELGVYADHQAADQATTHIPAILRGPGIPVGEQTGLHYHLDVAATVVDMTSAQRPTAWDGRSIRSDLEAGIDAVGRDALVLTQGAWSCQRGLRMGDHLYLRTEHDGFHPHWGDEMLFDVVADPHEQIDLATERTDLVAAARNRLDHWIDEQLARSYVAEDPLVTIMDEGGPFHVRGHLDTYLERLRATGRGGWVDPILERHPTSTA